MTDDNLISADAASQMLAVSKSTIFAWAKDPALNPDFPNKVEIKGSKRVLFSRVEMQDYLQLLLMKRATQPVSRNTGANPDPFAGLSEEDRIVLENRRMNRTGV